MIFLSSSLIAIHILVADVTNVTWIATSVCNGLIVKVVVPITTLLINN
jgi:hypothetical protein